jgi:hypothetical protein
MYSEESCTEENIKLRRSGIFIKSLTKKKSDTLILGVGFYI